MLAACFRSAEKEDTKPVESESESETNAEATSEDEATKQENKIESAKKAFEKELQNLDAVFKNNPDISPEIAVVAPEKPKGRGMLLGPAVDGEHKNDGKFIFAKSISSYPLKPKKVGDTSEEDGVKLGDPICDTYSFEAFDSKNVIFAVADGCNWGPKPLEAARIASTVFQDYMKSKLPRIDSVRKAGKCLVKAFMQAHTRILQAPLKRGINDIWETGTTTLLGGVILKLEDHASPYIFVSASVGDCKAFHISEKTGKVTDITRGNRPPASVTNVNDPGGRLGPYVGKDGSADLRNLGIFTSLCYEGDIVMICSDGVYDNLDPQQLNVPCRDIGIDADEWEQAKTEDAERAKDEYRCKFISDRLIASESDSENENDGSDGEDESDSDDSDKKKKKKSKKENNKSKVQFVPLEQFATVLLEHAYEVTEYSRKWMEEHPTARMPDARSKKRDPKFLGKMDHSTCVLVRVGVTE